MLPDEAEHEAAGAPESVEEALARARHHGSAAAAETLAMLRALLDAAALVSGGEPSGSHRLLAPLAKLLEGLALRIDEARGGGSGTQVLEAIAEALDAEIARWEQRARETPEARAVLRAFLGLRELLWEFGVRRPATAPAPGRPRKAGASRGRPRRARVQRVPVEG